jgi:hypothetical protein
MREFSFPLFPKGVKGLAPNDVLMTGLPYLATAIGVERTSYGVRRFADLEQPFGNADRLDYPFPQIVDTTTKLWLLGRTNVGEIEDSVLPWDVQFESLRKPAGGTTTITPGSRWHKAEYPGGFMAFNGSSIVFQNDNLANGAVYVEKDTTIATGCYHNGRVVCGNVELSEAAKTEWALALSRTIPELAQLLTEIGPNFVMWSSVGQIDFPLWFFYPQAYPQDYAVSEELMLDRFKSNELGFAPMPYKGEVVATLPLGDSVIVYTTRGIVRMQPLQTEQSLSYGIVPLGRLGVPYRDWVGGDTTEHYFVDTAGELWMMDAEFKITRLGFASHLADSLGSGLGVIVDRLNERTLIAVEDKTFSYAGGEFYEIPQIISDGITLDGAVYGPSEDNDYSQIILRTHPFDMQSAALKTVTSVTLLGRNYNPGTVQVEVSRDSDDIWVALSELPINREGNARVQATALRFRLVFRFPLSSDFSLENVLVHWQRSDRRFTRGPDVDSSSTGTGG